MAVIRLTLRYNNPSIHLLNTCILINDHQRFTIKSKFITYKKLSQTNHLLPPTWTTSSTSNSSIHKIYTLVRITTRCLHRTKRTSNKSSGACSASSDSTLSDSTLSDSTLSHSTPWSLAQTWSLPFDDRFSSEYFISIVSAVIPCVRCLFVDGRCWVNDTLVTSTTTHLFFTLIHSLPKSIFKLIKIKQIYLRKTIKCTLSTTNVFVLQ